MRAVLLLSGGLDSCTVAACLHARGTDFIPLTLHYGQRHAREVKAAESIAAFYGAREHVLMELDMRKIGGSALTAEDIGIPDVQSEGIPSTYVPARNTVFLSIALALAEARQASLIYYGANHIDYSGYPDCRPEYIHAFNTLSSLATKTGVEGRPVRVEAPLLDMGKSEIIKMGAALGAPYHLTWSCYRGGERACGRCDSCRIRLKGFMEAGIEDPVEYEDQ